MSEYTGSSVVLPASNQAPGWSNPAGQNSGNKNSDKLMIYKSDIMTNLVKMIERVAPSQANILVLGESGTGKELIAKTIHEKSNRRQKPFVAINCGALRETLLESELFGHEKGSFTGAYNRKIGLAEVANGGTLFLDEVGELSPSIQSKLLRFLQEGEIYRVGGKESIRVDIRLISATNRVLEEEVNKGNFREDLYYRVNTIVIDTPPLRNRKEDIPALVQHFLATNPHGAFLSRGKTIHEDAMTALVKYEWPGNIRELQNVCERLQILSDGHMIMLNDIPDQIRTPESKNDILDYHPSVTLYEIEKKYILKALCHYGGNKTQAAQNLGITIKTLYNKLHEYGEFENFSVHSKTKAENKS